MTKLNELYVLAKSLVLDLEGQVCWRAEDGSLEIGAERDAACRAIAREVIMARDAAERAATPLRAMAKAIYEVTGFTGFDPSKNELAMKEARAALRALAESEDLGRASLTVAYFGDEDQAMAIETDFRDMCRAIAKEET